MKPSILRYFCAALLALGSAACGNDPAAGDEGQPSPSAPQPVVLRFGIRQTRTTTTADYKTAFAENDAVGLYVTRHGTALAPSGNYADNLKFTFSGGAWSCPEAAELYFPADGAALDFYAYYPYREGVDPTDFAFAVAEDQSSAEFCAANDLLTAVASNIRNQPVTLTFAHALTLVNVAVLGENLDESLVVTLHNCVPAATVDLAAQRATASGTKTADIRMSRMAGGTATEANYRALIPAQQFAEGTLLFSFIQQTPGAELAFDYKTAAAAEFVGGKVSKWEISLLGDQHVYKVGDLFPYDGAPEGVVFEVSSGGVHGKVVYLHEEPGRPDDGYKCTRWGAGGLLQSENGVPGMSSLTDGETATRQLLTLRSGEADFATIYSAFNYVHATCNGGDPEGPWYMPAIEELKSLYAAVNGLVYADIADTWVENATFPGHAEGEDTNPESSKAFRGIVTGAGGDDFNFYGWYCSTTETGPNTMYAVLFNEGKFNSQEKTNEYAHVRPIRKF